MVIDDLIQAESSSVDVVLWRHCRKKRDLRGDGYRGCRVLLSVVSWWKVGSLLRQHGDTSRVRIGNCRRCNGDPSRFETTEARSISLSSTYLGWNTHLTQRELFGRAKLKFLEFYPVNWRILSYNWVMILERMFLGRCFPRIEAPGVLPDVMR